MIPFIDIKTQIQERIERVQGHGQFILGPEVWELESLG